jgi:hypothetical protein
MRIRRKRRRRFDNQVREIKVFGWSAVYLIVSGNAFGYSMKIIIAIFIVTALITAFLFFRQEKSVKNISTTTLPNVDTTKEMTTLDSVVSFGYKCMWIVVKTNDKDKIADILKIKNRLPCNWKQGIEQAYEDKIFITPQVGQWTFVVGWGLTNFSFKNELEEVKSFKNKIDKLSKEFGEAQFFATHRVSEYHLWAKSINGQTIRLYSYLGEKGENIAIEGQPTDFEKKYKLINTFSKEAKNENYIEKTDILIPDEEFLMKIAANWSIDPTTLEQRKDIATGLGILGR